MSIKLERMTDDDYDCYAGVETNIYFPGGFIKWDVPFNHFLCKDAVVVMDAMGIGVDLYDREGNPFDEYHKEMPVSESAKFLEEAPDTLSVDYLLSKGFKGIKRFYTAE